MDIPNFEIPNILYKFSRLEQIKKLHINYFVLAIFKIILRSCHQPVPRSFRRRQVYHKAKQAGNQVFKRGHMFSNFFPMYACKYLLSTVNTV